jgi:hypothetical protein
MVSGVLHQDPTKLEHHAAPKHPHTRSLRQGASEHTLSKILLPHYYCHGTSTTISCWSFQKFGIGGRAGLLHFKERTTQVKWLHKIIQKFFRRQEYIDYDIVVLAFHV